MSRRKATKGTKWLAFYLSLCFFLGATIYLGIHIIRTSDYVKTEATIVDTETTKVRRGTSKNKRASQTHYIVAEYRADDQLFQGRQRVFP